MVVEIEVVPAMAARVGVINPPLGVSVEEAMAFAFPRPRILDGEVVAGLLARDLFGREGDVKRLELEPPFRLVTAMPLPADCWWTPYW
jgi:hypothetical protein